MDNLDRQTDRLSKENTDCLKGILAACVLSHHLFQYSGQLRGTAAGTILQAMGYLAVSEFLFLSGYGLTISYKKRGAIYVLQFAKNRILPFYIVDILLIALYTVKNYVVWGQFQGGLIIQSFLFGNTIVGGGWYLQVQLLLYILWFFIYKSAVAEQAKRRLMLTIILVICFAMNFGGYGTTWYEGIPAFYIGILWAEYRDTIDICLNRWISWFACIIVSGGFFCGTFLCSHLLLNENAQIMTKMLSAVAFVICLTTCLYKMPVNCKLTKDLGKNSFEIYVTQFLFLDAFQKTAVCRSIKIYVLCVAMATALTASILRPICEAIYCRCKSF